MNWEERKYQQEAIAACLAGFAGRGAASVMLESPVGSGKTYMALETIHALQEVLGRKLKVDWVAPRRHLLRQVMECCQFQKVLADLGVACKVVTAESDKDRQLKDFVTGKMKVIVNVSMLTDGFDQPDVQTIFARDASRLPTIQMCGRGLRQAGGKNHCNVVQSAKTPYLFERVTPAQKRFRLINGQWMALQDGTEMIEKTLKLSLALLERRERMRAERKERPHGGSRPRTAAAADTAGLQK